MGLAYADGAVERAKRDGLYLVKLDLVGKYAKKGTVQFAGPVGPETAKRITEFFNELLVNDAERMK